MLLPCLQIKRPWLALPHHLTKQHGLWSRRADAGERHGQFSCEGWVLVMAGAGAGAEMHCHPSGAHSVTRAYYY